MRLEFAHSDPLTLGVELELQLVDLRSFNLTRGASDLLAALGKRAYSGEIKPEITESMIEIATGVAHSANALRTDLASIERVLTPAARALNLGLCGGGAHPFQKWSERRIYDAPRYRKVSEQYGYLAKQFTVFGQHIHVGCPSGDAAMKLTCGLARFVPHLIALSGSSPYFQGADTLFDSARSNAVSAFPLAGTMPPFSAWSEFEDYFERMRGYGIVESMKDFYWDIRPKPEYGTVEVRVCDTPLAAHWAVVLAAYVRVLAGSLLEEPLDPQEQAALVNVYAYNRFQACRFGLHATLIDPKRGGPVDIRSDLLETLDRVGRFADALGVPRELEHIYRAACERRNDAARVREAFDRQRSLADVVRWQCEQWWREPSAD